MVEGGFPCLGAALKHAYAEGRPRLLSWVEGAGWAIYGYEDQIVATNPEIYVSPKLAHPVPFGQLAAEMLRRLFEN